MAHYFRHWLVVTCVLIGGAFPAGASEYDAAESLCRNADASPQERIEACSKLLEDYAYSDLSDYTITHLNRGRAYLAIKQNTAALADLDKVLEYDPFAYEGYMARGESLLALGEAFRAIADFTVAIGLEPLTSAPYAWRGTALYANREYPEAQRDLEAALKFSPNDTRAMTTLAWILSAAPDPAQRDGVRALELAKQLIAGPTETSAPLQLVHAAALAESGDIDAAMALYQSLIDASSGNQTRFERYLTAANFLPAKSGEREKEVVLSGLRSCLESGCRVGAPLPKS